MLLLTTTTDSLQLTTSAATNIDVHVSYADNASGTITLGRTNTAISTATTTTILAAPGASTARNAKTVNIRNKGATGNTVTVLFDQNGTDFELFQVTLGPGDVLEYVEGVGWFTVTTPKLDVTLRVTADSVHATAATFADITGLTYAVESGKHYGFDARLIHVSNATTTGAQFAIGGVAMTAMILSTIDTVTASVTASTHSAGTVAAINTAATAQTTGSSAQTMGILSGWFQPSAAGTFAMRATSEVTVANGLTVKAGSWVRIWEF